MAINKNDFVEIEFIGKTQEGKVFDSNIKSELEKLNSGAIAKPLIFCLGEGMFLKGVEDFLQGKEIGEYEITLNPEDAFGNRDSSLIKIISLKMFHQQQTHPEPGMIFNFDNTFGKVLSVSGGRVITDFNNPLAGKTVVYNVKVLRKIEDTKTKIDSLSEFFFKKQFPSVIDESSKKIVLEVEKELSRFVKMFAEQFQKMLGFSIDVTEIEGKKSGKEEIAEEKK